MSRLREEILDYVSVPGACCMIAGGWLYLAGVHCNEEARRVSQAYVLDSLSGQDIIWQEFHRFVPRACMHRASPTMEGSDICA